MLLKQFQEMVTRMANDIPADYTDGIAAIDVSPKSLPHPVHPDVYTLGECIPIHADTEHVMSRVVLYYGSFRALAQDRASFDWQTEAWETLVHELRHHMEWRARSPQLEEYDWAAEQNFARAEARPFDPLFYRWGERIAEGIYRVDDDIFIECLVTRRPTVTEVSWHGVRYRVPVPSVPLPLYLALDGLRHPPPGDVLLVVRARARLWDLFRRSRRATGRRALVEPIE